MKPATYKRLVESLRHSSGNAVRILSEADKKPAHYTDGITPTVECIANDWVQFSFLTDLAWGQDKYNYGRFEFKKWSHGSKAWEHLYNVTLDGYAFGVFKCGVRTTTALKENECHFKLDNSVCYTDFRDAMLWFEKEVGTFHHVCRWDIAGDGKNILHPLNLTMQGKIHRVNAGRSNIMFNKAVIGPEGVKCTYFRLGSSQSEKYMRVYDKAKELKESGKKYIENYWKLNGVTDTNNMERLELTLMAKFCRQVFEIDYKCTTLAQILNVMFDNQSRSEVLNKYISGMYEFRLKDHKVITYCTLSYNLYYAKGILWRAIKVLSTAQRAVSEGIYAMKLSIKNCMQLAYRTKSHKYYQFAKELAINAHLLPYWKERKSFWLQEVKLKMKNTVPFLDFYEAHKASNPIKLTPILNGEFKFPREVREHVRLLMLNI